MMAAVDDDVDPRRELIWYARSDDPTYILRRSGVWMVVIALVLFACVGCAAISTGGPGNPTLVVIFALLVPAAAILAGVEWLFDRRAVVEMRLRPADRPTELEVLRVNRTTATYPTDKLTSIEITHSESAETSTTMRLHFGPHTERTRSGPGTLPDGWHDALTATGTLVKIRHRSSD